MGKNQTKEREMRVVLEETEETSTIIIIELGGGERPLIPQTQNENIFKVIG